MLSAHQPFERFPDAHQATRRARPARIGAGRRRRAGDVRRRHPGPARHGAVAVLARRDRAWRPRSRCRTTCSTPRCCLGICDKIVPGPADRRAALRPPAGGLRAGRADDHAACPTTRRRKVRQLYAEGKVGRDELLEAEVEVLPRPGHLHLLRHRQHQPDADGDHGPAPAGRRLRQPGHAAARRADRARRRSGRSRSPRWATTTRRSATSIDERAIVNGDRRPARHRRLDQPHASTWSRWRARPASCIDWDDFAELSRRRAAAGARLSERQGRREPFPRRRRHGLRDPRAARRRACCTTTCTTVAGQGPARATRSEPLLDGRRAGLARRRRRRAATPSVLRAGRRAVPAPTAACKLLTRQPRPRGHQGLGGQAGAPRRSRRRPLVFDDQEELQRRLQGRRARPRLRRRGPLPGAAGQRHAGAAQADAAARRAAGPRLQGGAGHRRPHVAAPRARCRRRST